MKVTKRQLKNIIKEEIEAALSEQAPGPDMAEAEELATTFEKSPAIMDAVEQAMQDPKVQAALEKATSMQEGSDPYGDAYRKRAKLARAGLIGLGGGTVAAGATAAILPAALMLLMPALAVSPAIVALGITAGPALMAIGHIISNKFGRMMSDQERKAADPSAREASDFPYWTHAKMTAQERGDD
jgi:hypothetical protein